MKYSRTIRSMSTALAFAFAFMVFSFSFAPKAYAADANLSLAYGIYAYYSNYTTPAFYTSTDTTPIVDGNYIPSNTVPFHGDIGIFTDSNTLFSSNVKIYASYYFKTFYQNTFYPESDDYLNPSNWSVTYVNDYGETGTGTLDEYREITGNSLAINNATYVLEASLVGSELHPVRDIRVFRTDPNTGFYMYARSNYPMIVFPSIRVITTQYSAEMEALDNVASEIASQSDILLAMKGDIVAILQDIYAMTGDMYIAQNLLNGYIQQMLPLIQNINQTTTNIYGLLSSQLAALETAIETASTTIEAAIEAQTAAMIAYLDELFDTGNEVPDDTYQQQQDAENILNDLESLEKPDVETIVPEIDDYTDGGVSGVLSAIFSSSLIVTMMTLSASLAFGAYVLFGKRG